MSVISRSSELEINGQVMKVEDILAVLKDLPSKEVVAFFNSKGMNMPRKVRMNALHKVLDNRVKKAEFQKTFTDEMRYRLKWINTFSEYQLEGVLSLISNAEIYNEYRENIWLMFLKLYEELKIDTEALTGLYETARGYKMVPKESVVEYNRGMDSIFYDERNEVDGLEYQTFREVLSKSSTGNELRDLGAKYNIDVPRRIKKEELAEIIIDGVSAAGQMTQEEQEKIKKMSVQQLQRYAKQNGVKASIELKKEDIIEYIISRVETEVQKSYVNLAVLDIKTEDDIVEEEPVEEVVEETVVEEEAAPVEEAKQPESNAQLDELKAMILQMQQQINANNDREKAELEERAKAAEEARAQEEAARAEAEAQAKAAEEAKAQAEAEAEAKAQELAEAEAQHAQELADAQAEADAKAEAAAEEARAQAEAEAQAREEERLAAEAEAARIAEEERLAQEAEEAKKAEEERLAQEAAEAEAARIAEEEKLAQEAAEAEAARQAEMDALKEENEALKEQMANMNESNNVDDEFVVPLFDYEEETPAEEEAPAEEAPVEEPVIEEFQEITEEAPIEEVVEEPVVEEEGLIKLEDTENQEFSIEEEEGTVKLEDFDDIQMPSIEDAAPAESYQNADAPTETTVEEAPAKEEGFGFDAPSYDDSSDEYGEFNTPLFDTPIFEAPVFEAPIYGEDKAARERRLGNETRVDKKKKAAEEKAIQEALKADSKVARRKKKSSGVATFFKVLLIIIAVVLLLLILLGVLGVLGVLNGTPLETVYRAVCDLINKILGDSLYESITGTIKGWFGK